MKLRIRNLNILALCETKLKGRGEESFENKLGHKSGMRKIGQERSTHHCEG